MCYYNITTEINQDIKKTEKEISCYNECAGGINSDSLTVPNNMGGGGGRGEINSVLKTRGKKENMYSVRKATMNHIIFSEKPC